MRMYIYYKSRPVKKRDEEKNVLYIIMQLFIFLSYNIIDKPYKIELLKIRSFLFLKKNLNLPKKKLNKIIFYILLNT